MRKISLLILIGILLMSVVNAESFDVRTATSNEIYLKCLELTSGKKATDSATDVTKSSVLTTSERTKALEGSYTCVLGSTRTKMFVAEELGQDLGLTKVSKHRVKATSGLSNSELYYACLARSTGVKKNEQYVHSPFEGSQDRKDKISDSGCKLGSIYDIPGMEAKEDSDSDSEGAEGRELETTGSSRSVSAATVQIIPAGQPVPDTAAMDKVKTTRTDNMDSMEMTMTNKGQDAMEDNMAANDFDDFDMFPPVETTRTSVTVSDGSSSNGPSNFELCEGKDQSAKCQVDFLKNFKVKKYDREIPKGTFSEVKKQLTEKYGDDVFSAYSE